MEKEILYRYLGTNGVITSPVHLEDIYYVRMFKIFPDKGKVLTKDNKKFYYSLVIPEEEFEQWYEVEDNGQE